MQGRWLVGPEMCPNQHNDSQVLRVHDEWCEKNKSMSQRNEKYIDTEEQWTKIK